MTEDHWTTNAISEEDDAKLAAEEEAKSEIEVLREALAILTKAHLRLVERVRELEVAAHTRRVD
jgi:hypothetical protein